MRWVLPRFGWLILAVSLVTLIGCASLRGVYHTVQKGQTLYQIARSYDVDPERLARLNGVQDPRKLAVGDRLFIPGASQVRHVPATVASAPVVVSAPVSAKPTERQLPRPTPVLPSPVSPPTRTPPVHAPPAALVSAPTVSSSARPTVRGSLGWPVRGEVIKKFGAKAASPGKNGIEIAIRDRSEVVSSAAGKVIYSGNGIAGYGNLVILQHEDALYTIYGYNRKNLVASGAFVGKGDKIALSGVPPSGGLPRLYFEVRQGKKPVDPIFYLP